MADVAGAVIASIESHGQFLTTLALATSGATFAFLLQVIFHNSKRDTNPIRIRYPSLLIVAILFNCLSIIFWYMMKSSVVAAIPAIYEFAWKGESTTKVLRNQGFNVILILGQLQILFFVASIVALIVVLFMNFPLISGASGQDVSSTKEVE